MTNNDNIPEDSPFRVHSRREIVSLLTSLIQGRQLLKLLVNGGNESILTSILNIDEKEGEMIIDAAPDDMLNHSIRHSNHISFATTYNDISITFSVDKAQTCLFQNGPAFRVAIPSSLVRLQRREYFRVTTPITTPLCCTFRIEHEDGTFATVITRLNNISAGGVSLTDEKQVLDATPGRLYENCSLEISDNTIVTVKLEVRDSKVVKLHSGKIVTRIGCEFIDLPQAVLGLIQRFITRLERQRNAKASGMV